MSQDSEAVGASVTNTGLPSSLEKALAARQRKIEKNLRRKRYDDLQVQGTNNSSIVSKRLVEMLYYSKIRPTETPWFECFVAKPKNRLPSINRGYLIRMESVRRSIEKIIAHHQKQSQTESQDRNGYQPSQVRIVNLGCGFDPLAFQLLETFGDSLFFVDVDYPELVKSKLQMMQASQKITNIVGTKKDPSDPSVIFQARNYALVGCDLKDLESYERILANVCGQAPLTIFIAEVSLAYMKPDDADAIIQLLAKVPKSHSLVLEQILPYGRDHIFAQKMLAHFKKLRSPIQCVEKYPTRFEQKNRFNQVYDTVSITDLFENWRKVPDYEKLEINDIEDFDEWEEFILFCHHYVLIHSYNDDTYQSKERDESVREIHSCHQSPAAANTADNNDSALDMKSLSITNAVHDNDSALNMKSLSITNDVHDNDSALNLKFPAVCSIDEHTIFIHGGANQSRQDTTFLLTSENKVILIECSGTPPGGRMCHSATAIAGGVLIVGGRTRPRFFCHDAFFYKNDHWTKVASPIAARARHCAVAINEKVLVFGGLEDSHSLDDLFESYDPSTGAWQKVNVVGESPPNLRAACMAHNGTFGIIFGGYDKSYEPSFNDHASYTFTFDGSSVFLKSIDLPRNVRGRIGAKCEFFDENTLIVVGGIGLEPLLSTVTTYDLESGIARNVDTSKLAKTPPLFIGHGIAIVNINGLKAVKAVCGGAVCYSFGSAYSGIFSINE